MLLLAFQTGLLWLSPRNMVIKIQLRQLTSLSYNEKYLNFSYIGGHEFFDVIDTLHADFPLTDHGIVVGISCNQESLWSKNKIIDCFHEIYVLDMSNVLLRWCSRSALE